MAGARPRISPASARLDAIDRGVIPILTAGKASAMPIFRWHEGRRLAVSPRRLAGYALAVVLAPLLTVLLAIVHGQLNPATDVLAFVIAVIAVALLGGLAPAVLEAIAGSLLLSFHLLPPMHTFSIAAANNAAALSVFIAVAVVVSLLADKAVRRAGQAAAAIAAAEPIAEADRMRVALLAAVSHDLRTPLAAAKAAVSCLRSRDIELTAEDQDELLATADESLDLLGHLVASLLDVSRLQVGVLPVFPRPADLREIVARSLDGMGPQARAIRVGVPRELPQVMVDPVILERVIANVTANALRYSPGGSPPLLTACARAERVELRVIDHGPGVPQADRDRIFLPFQRLDGIGSATSIGLGLTVSRGLTEAMRGTLEPEETPGGGLTMAISVPVARGSAQAYLDNPGRGEREASGSTRRPAGYGAHPSMAQCC
jgi:two-component system sensor histidine kinase KdpD